jgi:tRNA threonylcarbamoyladenosine biosynthesis protein TsaB
MLLPLIDRVLLDSGITMKAIDIFAVAQGPGSFTALRMGMSVTLGLSIAAQKNIIPIPSLDGLAYNAGACEQLICPMLDARRGEVYYALYHRDSGHTLKRLTPYCVASPERILQAIEGKAVLLGDGFMLYRDLFMTALQERAVVAPEHLHYPRASAIGALAMQRFREHPPEALFQGVMPLYVRPPDAGAK